MSEKCSQLKDRDKVTQSSNCFCGLSGHHQLIWGKHVSETIYRLTENVGPLQFNGHFCFPHETRNFFCAFELLLR